MAPADDDEDEFDFSDPDLDFLPINTLQEFEANALRATQPPHQHLTQHQHHQPHAALESDYGLDDGDQVINLDSFTSHSPHNHTHTHQDPPHSQPPQSQPPRSQADPDALLLRIKQVRHPCLTPCALLMSLPARAGQAPREEGRRRSQGPAADQIRRG